MDSLSNILCDELRRQSAKLILFKPRDAFPKTPPASHFIVNIGKFIFPGNCRYNIYKDQNNYVYIVAPYCGQLR